MADHSHIEWTDATWNPITGCSVVSPGCTNCYAMKLAGTRLRTHPSRAGLTRPSKAGPVWTGEVRLNEAWLDQPLTWPASAHRIFVCAHGDLFHEAAPDAWIDRVFLRMAAAPDREFQVLTKRAERMAAYLDNPFQLARRLEALPDRLPDLESALAAKEQIGNLRRDGHLAHVLIGVSVEDQVRANERRSALARVASLGWPTFVSYEPALGPVDWTGWEFIRWLIAGGESGPGARPMHPDWVRAALAWAAAHGAAFLFKQWGAWLPWEPAELPSWRSQAGGWMDRHQLPDFGNRPKGWTDACLFDGADDCVHQLVGKKAAGRTLDGVTHDGFPDLSETRP